MQQDRMTTGEITQTSKDILCNVAQYDDIWAKYLRVMAEHTGRSARRTDDGHYEAMDNYSALNCAQIAASAFKDTRETLTVRDWQKMFPDAAPKNASVGIPVVKASSTGKNVWADIAYPADAMTGLPDQRFHNLPTKIDLRDDVDAECWAAATRDLFVYRVRKNADGKTVFEDGRPVKDKVSVALDEIDPSIAYVVATHYGLDIEAPASPTELAGDPVALKTYCELIKNDASALLGQINRSIKIERERIMGIDRVESQHLPVTAERDVRVSQQDANPRTCDPTPPIKPYAPAGKSPAENARAAFDASQRPSDQQAKPNQGMIP